MVVTGALFLAVASASFEVSVDPRIELIHALFRSQGAVEFVWLVEEGPWLQEADALIRTPACHAARTLTATIRRRYGVSYADPAELALFLPLDLDGGGVDVADAPGKWSSIPETGAYLQSIQDCARAADWVRVMFSDSPVDELVERRMTTLLDLPGIERWVEMTFGPLASVRIHPSPSSGSRNYGLEVGDAIGAATPHPVLGVWVSEARGTVMTASDPSWLVVHEITHGVMNSRLALDRDWMDIIAPVVRERDAESTVRDFDLTAESLARAVTNLYVRDREAQRLQDYQATDEVQGFHWIDALSEALQRSRSETGRIDWDSAKGEARVLLARWGARREGGGAPPFRATVASASSWVRQFSVVPRRPLRSVDRYLEQIRHRFYLDVERVVPDARTPLPNAGFVAYGTPSSHPWIARVASSAGWSIEADRVSVAGRTYLGQGLALIAVWPNPVSTAAPALVYAAADAGTLRGINSVHHGPTDWLIVQRTEAGFTRVAQGWFAKEDGVWLPSATGCVE